MAAPNIADLFGDSDEDDDFVPAARPKEVSPSPAKESQGAKRQASALSDDDDDFQDVPAPRQPEQLQEFSDDDDDAVVQEAPQERQKGPPQDMSAALLPLPPINKLRLLQTSKFLAVQTLPTTSENLKLERDSAVLDEETEEIRYSYKKQMTMRWRERTLPSGEKVRESNTRLPNGKFLLGSDVKLKSASNASSARFHSISDFGRASLGAALNDFSHKSDLERRVVKWSDGTTQLLLGDEVLDIAELDNTGSNQFLFVRLPLPAAFIQGQGQLIKKLHLRPASLSSKFHKQLTAEAARKHTKVNKVKATATVIDPNRLKADREKAEEERIRSREMLQRRQEREMKRYPTSSRREARPAGLTPQFLETIEDEPDYSDEEEDPESLENARAALHRKRPLEEEEEREAERRLAKAKQDRPSARNHPSEERQERQERLNPRAFVNDDEDGKEDDDDEDDILPRQPVKRARRGLVLSDEDDD